MKQELEQSLFERYPSIFKYTDESGQEVICYPEVGDGWYNIINTICSIITSSEEAKTKWLQYRKNKGETIHESEYEQPLRAVQIKEKFGGLRFYTTGGNEFSRGVIFMGEAMSMYTCEMCGNKGTETDDGWIKVLCETHKSERRWRTQNELRPETVLPNS